jgi:hypothetical protein
MVYDGALMRSILALGLAALILAAHAPGLFTETPVCAAVDGVRAAPAGFLWHKSKPRPQSPSCCGTPDCPMHARGCGKAAACTMDAAYGPDPKVASADRATHSLPVSNETKLCAPSCGREGARVAPGLPDPGTIETGGRTIPCLAETGRAHWKCGEPPTHITDPAVPPPRS